MFLVHLAQADGQCLVSLPLPQVRFEGLFAGKSPDSYVAECDQARLAKNAANWIPPAFSFAVLQVPAFLSANRSCGPFSAQSSKFNPPLFRKTYTVKRCGPAASRA